MTRARIVGTNAAGPLNGGWEVTALAPHRAQTPSDLAALTPEWIPCEQPMPAAAALRAAKRWSPERPRDFDSEEWWYRCRFAVQDPGTSARLRFEGLATVADAWLNGVHILHSENMFVANTVAVDDLLRSDNELVIRCYALGPLLAAKRPRPRWRTRLVAHQQLRWYRTTLLGRIPGWCPPIAPAGPWRPVLIERGAPYIEDADLHVSIDRDDGVVGVSVVISGIHANAQPHGTMTVGAHACGLEIESSTDAKITLRAVGRVPQVERWWPHTHGKQPLYPAHLSLVCGVETITIDLGRVGFRDLQVERGADGTERFAVSMNGVEIFCRGACWTPIDIVRLDAEEVDYRATLERLRESGVNMLRVGGTMTYEPDVFHDLCDELGILLWQDFMFANMDYPSEDPLFSETVDVEARQLLRRLQGRPSLVVLCGSSEVEQQAAMLGLPAERWKNRLFDEQLSDLVKSAAPGVEWLSSTPTGGTMPFHSDRGVAHYYGVSAYLRPFTDARHANVRFASECLAFSNVPDRAMVDELLSAGAAPGHHPRWKAGVPRDAGVGWDFEDVRDHYVRVLFGVDPSEVRARDADRYLALGRVASAEAMLRTFAEWRRPGSTCRGGLVWFARDLVPGAGWGILDCTGRPKAVYWYLKRALAPVSLLAVDEGLNGLWLHAVNDSCEPIEAQLQIALYREGLPCGRPATTDATIPGRSARSIHADAVFERFVDLTYAYRFGPPDHDVVAATLRDRSTGARLATAHWFPCGLPARSDDDLGLIAHAEPCASGYVVTVQAKRFAHAVEIATDRHFVPDDNYFHLAPGETWRVTLRGDLPIRPLCGAVSALNSHATVALPAIAHSEDFSAH